MLRRGCRGGVRGIESGVVGWYVCGGEPACEPSYESFSSGGVCRKAVSVWLCRKGVHGAEELEFNVRKSMFCEEGALHEHRWADTNEEEESPLSS